MDLRFHIICYQCYRWFLFHVGSLSAPVRGGHSKNVVLISRAGGIRPCLELLKDQNPGAREDAAGGALRGFLRTLIYQECSPCWPRMRTTAVCLGYVLAGPMSQMAWYSMGLDGV